MSIQETGHLSNKKFRRLTYDMMVAWEIPAATETLASVSFLLTITLGFILVYLHSKYLKNGVFPRETRKSYIALHFSFLVRVKSQNPTHRLLLLSIWKFFSAR